MARTGLHSHKVALLEGEFVHVDVVTLARRLELHLHDVAGLCVVRQVGQPVECIELICMAAATACADASVAVPTLELLFHFSFFFL